MTAPAYNKGFTLLELLVALGIMLAIAVVAIPQFARAMDYVELRRSTQLFAATLRDARNRSITQSRAQEIIFDASERYLRTESNGILYEWPLSVTVRPEGLGYPDDVQVWPIIFYPDGTATEAAIAVSVRQRSYVIDVDWLTGRVRVL